MGAPMNVVADDALGTDDVVGLLERLRNREVSPGELVDAARGRLTAAAQLNAVVTPATDNLLVNDEGPFAGIPSIVKDNEDVTGLPTTQGSGAVRRIPATNDSLFVQQYRALGFGVLGKSSMPEFGLTATTEPLQFGPTRNPWHTDHTVGGSSGGSAALVAAGALPIAHANDGGGSIRIPASCCGLVGLKPSRGRIVMPERMQGLPIKFATQGVLTRSVRDTALFYEHSDSLNHELAPIGPVRGPNDQRLRIGLVTSGVHGMPLDPEVVGATEAAAALCEQLGHKVELVDQPFGDNIGRDFLRYWASLAAAITYGGRFAYGPGFDADQLEPLTRGLSKLFASTAARLPNSIRRLRAFGNLHADVMNDWDVIITPVLGYAPPEIGYLSPGLDFRTHIVRLLRFAAFTPVDNVAGNPAISLPLGHSATGLPIGVQFSTGFGQERRLLELAYEIEEARPWPVTSPTGSSE